MLGYGAALAWGLAAGLLGYRFGVLPLHLESPRPEVHDSKNGIRALHRARCRFPDEPRQRWREPSDR